MMNPSPTEIVELFSFVEVTSTQYAIVAGHFPGVTAASVKPNPKKVNKAEVTPGEPRKPETQVKATTPTPNQITQKGKYEDSQVPAKVEGQPEDAKKGGKSGGKGKNGMSEPRLEKRKQQCIHFFGGTCQRGDQCRYEHQGGEVGWPVPVGPEILQRFDEAVKRYNENTAQAQAKPKAAPRGRVTASIIVLHPDDLEHGLVVSAAKPLDNDHRMDILLRTKTCGLEDSVCV